MFLILSAVLNLGNVEFVADDNGESAIDCKQSKKSVDVVAVSQSYLLSSSSGHVFPE